jgi:hypothetical protein
MQMPSAGTERLTHDGVTKHHRDMTPVALAYGIVQLYDLTLILLVTLT